MARQARFTLMYAPELLEHLRFIDRKHHPLIREAVQTQLQFTPLETTRNRKMLDIPAPFDATWELRCGPNNRYRVFYTVEIPAAEMDDLQEGSGIVTVLALGEKDGNRLLFAGKELIP